MQVLHIEGADASSRKAGVVRNTKFGETALLQIWHWQCSSGQSYKRCTTLFQSIQGSWAKSWRLTVEVSSQVCRRCCIARSGQQCKLETTLHAVHYVSMLYGSYAVACCTCPTFTIVSALSFLYTVPERPEKAGMETVHNTSTIVHSVNQIPCFIMCRRLH